jgi:hypothetical protein
MEKTEAEEDLGDGDEDRNDNEDNDDPCLVYLRN